MSTIENNEEEETVSGTERIRETQLLSSHEPVFSYMLCQHSYGVNTVLAAPVRIFYLLNKKVKNPNWSCLYCMSQVFGLINFHLKLQYCVHVYMEPFFFYVSSQQRQIHCRLNTSLPFSAVTSWIMLIILL